MWILIALTIYAYGDFTTAMEAKQLRGFSSERECDDAKASLNAGVGPMDPKTVYLCNYVGFPLKK